MNVRLLDAAALEHALTLRDLTDPSAGPHAMQQLVSALGAVLTTPTCLVREHRGASRVVDIADNYDRLRFPIETVTRDARYTRYVTPDSVLRTHTSALVPPCLRSMAREPTSHAYDAQDVQLIVPGIVYRRDCIDRLHAGEPHQIDLWRVRRSRLPRLSRPDLDLMIAAVVQAVLPGHTWRTSPAVHPYTLDGLQIDVESAHEWIEIGECGLAHPEVLAAAGLVEHVSGLAMGLGLDRILMLRKRVPDIRLLRAADPRIAAQMLDLEPYRPVSSMPAVRRDLSIAVAMDVTAEELGDQVRAALGPAASSIEEIAVISETPAAALPVQARERLGLGSAQKNVLLRVVLRDLTRTLTHAEANDVRNAIYGALHQGTVYAWAR